MHMILTMSIFSWLTRFNWTPPGQNGCHFVDNILKHILNENVRILIKISLKFVSKGPNENKSALVQVMAWRRTGDKPLPEPMLTQVIDIYAALGEDDLIFLDKPV